MAAEHDTHHKALTINLDPTVYGTIAEIGAGQEVARWFLQAGGASGTVAKTISAYDMTVSDAIYGKVPRYVSRPRLEGMLEHEYTLLLERLRSTRDAGTRFFVLADTVSARNFAGTNECHGWMGIRFQATPGGAANDIVLHVNFLDATNLLQQQAAGILGVNLVFAAFYRRASWPEFLRALFEELARRIEVDLVGVSGPDLAGVDERAATLELVQDDFAQAVIFPAEGPPLPPSEAIRKRPLVLAPGVFAPPRPVHAAMLTAACAQLAAEIGPEESEPLPLFVLTGRHPGEPGGASTPELVERVEALHRLGATVLVAREPEVYRVVRFALRYTGAPIRVVLGALTLADLLQTRYYRHLDGELMEALAQLFASNVRMYVYPMPAAMRDRLDPVAGTWIAPAADDGVITLEHLVVPPPTSHLLAYLIESGFMQPLPAA